MRLEHLLSGARKRETCQGRSIGKETSDSVLLSIEVYTHNPAGEIRQGEKDEAARPLPTQGASDAATRSPALSASPIAQLVRAPH